MGVGNTCAQYRNFSFWVTFLSQLPNGEGAAGLPTRQVTSPRHLLSSKWLYWEDGICDLTTLVFQPSLAVWAQGLPALPVGRGLLRASSWTLGPARRYWVLGQPQANFTRRPRVSAALARTSGAGSLSSSWRAGGQGTTAGGSATALGELTEPKIPPTPR